MPILNHQFTAEHRRIAVAIVDDEAAVRAGLRRLCDALGFHATAYASARAFLDIVEVDPWRPDCLLLDIQMPEITGFELQRLLVERGVKLPTIVITADDSPQTQARCVAAGLTEHLRKPIGAEELVAAVERVSGG